MKQIEARDLLKIGEGASPADINEAFRKRAHEVRKRFDAARKRKNREDREDCETLFEKLKKARALLIEPPDPPPPPDPIALKEIKPGMLFAGRFELQRELGRGGMGVVWLARDRTLEREVALKFLPDLIARDQVAANDLREETRQSIELSHPGIARVYDFVADEGRVAISMEYIDGQTLSELRLKEPNQIFETRDLERWVQQLCEALEYAHKRAMLTHCDINPSNLMVNSKGNLQITDFGIAKRIPDSMIRLDPARGTGGALMYMSPQQALGQKPTVTDDVYSLGATLYELLTGKPPFYKGEIWAQLKENIPPTLAERRAELQLAGDPIPAPWEETVAACLAKDASQRPQSAIEVAERLEKPVLAPVRPSPKPIEPIEPAPPSIDSPPSFIDPGLSTIDPALASIQRVSSPIDPALASIDRVPSPIDRALASIDRVPSPIDRALSFIDPAVSSIHPTHSSINEVTVPINGVASSVDPRSKTVASTESPHQVWFQRNTGLAIGGIVSIIAIAMAIFTPLYIRQLNTTPGRLILNTVPAYATVFLDGTSRDSTPLILDHLAPGEHRLTIELEGYEVQQLIVVVKPGDQGTFPLIRLTPKRDAVHTVTPSPTVDIVTPSPNGYRGERYPQTRERFLTKDEIANMDLTDIQYALNEMYARHGAPFTKEPDLQKQFQNFDWYHPVPARTLPQIDTEFSPVEGKNRDLLAQLRDQKRPR